MITHSFTPLKKVFYGEHVKDGEEISIEGRLIRLPLNQCGKIVSEKDPVVSKYLYGYACGGFGCKSHSLGNAIFVEYMSDSIRSTLNLKALGIKTNSTSDRWESYFPIEVADLPEPEYVRY